MQQQQIEIVNKLGLHARAATKLANTASRFNSSIQISFNSKTIDGKSIMSLMLLAASKGSRITLSADGEDEEVALSEISQLINDKFGEGE